MVPTLLLVFLVVILIVSLVRLLTISKDGFADVKQQHNNYALRQEQRWGNIGLSLLSNKREGTFGSSANDLLLTYGEKKNYPLDDKRRDLWGMIDKCESIKTMDCGAFDDPAFSLNCGMCLDIGKNSDNVPATGGLVLLPDDKANARESAHSNFLPDYKPTIGFCPTKKMVSTKAECLKLQRQLLCEKNSSFDLPGCSQCYSDTNYSIVDESTSPGVITGSGQLILTGLGVVRIHEQGFDPTKQIVLNKTTPYVYNVRGQETSRIKFVINPPEDSDSDNPTIPYISGIVSGGTGTGTFTSDLRRIVLNDENTGRKPRSSGKDTINGITVTRMAPGFGQTNASIVVIVPFSFVETTMEESTMCKDAPFVTTQAAAEFLGSDPCYKKGSGPGKFSIECLQGAWLSNGCTESGTAYPRDSVKAAALMTAPDGSFLTLNQISDYIYNNALITSTGIDENGKKQEIKEWSKASVFCTGREITSPCDTPNKDSGPLPPDCIVYLWNNQGSKKLWNGGTDPIGPTYYTSNSVSLFSAGPTLRSCQATGTLSPTDANGQMKKNIIAYWQKQGGVNNVKQVMADLHRAANAQVASDDQLAPYFKQCYGDVPFAQRPATVAPTPATAALSVFQNMFNSAGCTKTLVENDVTWWRGRNTMEQVQNDMNAYGSLTANCSGSQTQHDFCSPGKCVPSLPKIYTLDVHSDSGGNDISYNRGLSRDACQKACNADPKCKGFNYNYLYQGCYLKNAVNTPLTANGELLFYTRQSDPSPGISNVKYVRLEGVNKVPYPPGPAWLNFSQLVVLNENGDNISVRRPVTSSGAHNPRTLAEFANDGVEMNRGDGGMFHSITLSGKDFWQVTLDSPQTVSTVVVYNRQDCCQERMEAYQVVLLDSNSSILWKSGNLSRARVQAVKPA